MNLSTSHWRWWLFCSQLPRRPRRPTDLWKDKCPHPTFNAKTKQRKWVPPFPNHALVLFKETYVVLGYVLFSFLPNSLLNIIFYPHTGSVKGQYTFHVSSSVHTIQQGHLLKECITHLLIYTLEIPPPPPLLLTRDSVLSITEWVFRRVNGTVLDPCATTRMPSGRKVTTALLLPAYF